MVNYRYPSVLFPNKTLLIIYAYQRKTCISMASLEAQHAARKNDMDEKGCLCLRCSLRESWWCLNAFSKMTFITVGYKY